MGSWHCVPGFVTPGQREGVRVDADTLSEFSKELAEHIERLPQLAVTLQRVPFQQQDQRHVIVLVVVVVVMGLWRVVTTTTTTKPRRQHLP